MKKESRKTQKKIEMINRKTQRNMEKINRKETADEGKTWNSLKCLTQDRSEWWKFAYDYPSQAKEEMRDAHDMSRSPKSQR